MSSLIESCFLVQKCRRQSIVQIIKTKLIQAR